MAKKKVSKKASKKKKLRVKKVTPLLKEQARKEGISVLAKSQLNNMAFCVVSPNSCISYAVELWVRE